jgi:hypothetical protein
MALDQGLVARVREAMTEQALPVKPLRFGCASSGQAHG